MVTKCLSNELPTGILINSICPGYCKTNMSPNGTIDPNDSVKQMIQIIETQIPNSNSSGQFFRRNGQIYPW
jgi:NAD(P)-dependent dehydrogenase (short-subunit alcohol dehydrogenase family)